MRKRSFIIRGYAFAGLLWLLVADALAGTVLPITVNGVSNDTLGLEPGDTLFIASGARSYLTIRDFEGTEEAPICIINQGGLVYINSTSDVYYQQGINIKNCHYIRLLGNGEAELTYGFEVAQTRIGSGVDIREGSGGIELGHLEIHHTQFAGIIAKDDPDCEGRYLRDHFLMKALYFHHNYLHHTTGEGMYIGHTAYAGKKVLCAGLEKTLYPHLIEAVEIAHNKFRDIGREAIQVFSAPKNVRVHHNEVEQYALNLEQSHSNAFTLGLGTSGEASHNHISTGYGHGIALTGSDWYLHNNVIEGVGMLYGVVTTTLACGIYVDQGSLPQGARVGLANNTIVNSKHNGIRLVANGPRKEVVMQEVVVWNNLLAACGNGTPLFDGRDTTAFYFWNPSSVVLKSNLDYNDVARAGFVAHAQGNFNLTEQAEAINSGTAVVEGWRPAETDMEGHSRKTGSCIDIGAVEYPKEVSNAEISPLWACKQVFYPGRALLDGKDIVHHPGDTFCLARGDWPLLQMRNFAGSDDTPVVFLSYNGRLSFKETHVGLRLNNMQQVSFSRMHGDSAPWYFQNIRGDGVVVEDCENLHLAHFRMERIGNYGVKIASVSAKTALEDANETKGFELSHSLFNQGEGKWAVYAVGHPDGYIEGINIHHNHFLQQQGGAFRGGFTKGEIAVWKNEFSEQETTVLQFDACERLNMYANTLRSSTATLLEVRGVRRAYVHNNLLLAENGNPESLIRLKNSVHKAARFEDFQWVNNTVVLQHGYALENSNSDWTSDNSALFNNILVRTEPQREAFLGLSAGINLFLATDLDKEFVDPLNEDYHLLPTSKAMCAGAALSLDFMKLDFDLSPRLNIIDMGAFAAAQHLNAVVVREETMQLYPNPSFGTLQIEWQAKTAGQASYCIIDLQGNLCKEGVLNSCGTALHVEELQAGTYLLEVTQGEIVSTQPFVLQPH